MQFRTFENQISPMPVFNLNDIRRIDATFKRQQLNYWLKQKFIKKLVAGYYSLHDQIINESLLYFIANHIYESSYISLETALALYQIIPEHVFGVTSISTRKTKPDFGFLSLKMGIDDPHKIKSTYREIIQAYDFNQLANDVRPFLVRIQDEIQVIKFTEF